MATRQVFLCCWKQWEGSRVLSDGNPLGWMVPSRSTANYKKSAWKKKKYIAWVFCFLFFFFQFDIRFFWSSIAIFSFNRSKHWTSKGKFLLSCFRQNGPQLLILLTKLKQCFQGIFAWHGGCGHSFTNIFNCLPLTLLENKPSSAQPPSVPAWALVQGQGTPPGMEISARGTQPISSPIHLCNPFTSRLHTRLCCDEAGGRMSNWGHKGDGIASLVPASI